MTNSNQSLIILPFRNGSDKKEYEFLCDGIAEELINILSFKTSLNVISKKSAFSFKGKETNISGFKEALEVDFVVEGLVRFSGNKIRINAELIDVESEEQIWSGKWDRSVASLFDLEDEVALLIADVIREQVGHFEISDSPIHRQKIDFDIYQKVLEAKYLFFKWNPTDTEKAILLFKKVLEEDSKNMDALIGLSDAYSFMAMTNFMNPMEAWEVSEGYTNQAYAIDPNHAGVYYLKSHSAFFTKGNFKDALQYALIAVELKSTYSEALQFVAFFYTLSGDFDNANAYFEKALMLDPLNQETLFFKAYYEYRLGNYSKAIHQFENLIETNPYNLPAIVTKSYVLIKSGRFKENLEYINSFSSDLLIPDEKLGLTCVTHLASNNKAADKTLAQLQVAAKEPLAFQAKSYLYWSYALMGKLEEAIMLARSIKDLQISIILISLSDPIVECIFEHPDFKALVNEVFNIDALCVPTVIKKENANLIQDEELKSASDQLMTYMSEEEAFLNPKLTLRSLALSMQMHPNHLSYVLNKAFNKNFNAFVNDYRIDYFKKIALDPSKSHISLLGLAYESGFNSKTVFNTYFKKKEGITPGAYMKQQKLVLIYKSELIERNPERTGLFDYVTLYHNI